MNRIAMRNRGRPRPTLRAGREREAGFALALALCLLGPGSVTAEETSETAAVPGQSSPEAKPEEVGLDRLLQLPERMTFGAEQRKGVSADDWRARFRAASRAIRESHAALAVSKRKLEEAAGGGAGWQVAPPGANQTEVSPLSFKLREDLRRDREAVEQAEREYRELVIEADLAGVPRSWREPGDEAPAR